MIGGGPLFELVLQKFKEIGARPPTSEKERIFPEFLRDILLSFNFIVKWETFLVLSIYI
ncbi:MAG: hypothetical protein ACUVTO_06410 [Candidatus Caldatribacteriaceae bacterium]